MNNFDFPIHAEPADPQLPPGHSPYSPNRPRKHGFVPELGLGTEERSSFYALEERMYDEYRPTCATESLLLDEVTLNYWRLQRARNLESKALDEERENLKLLALYARYRRDFEQSFYRALQMLRKVKADNARLFTNFRRSRESAARPTEFVSQNVPAALDDAA